MNEAGYTPLTERLDIYVEEVIKPGLDSERWESYGYRRYSSNVAYLGVEFTILFKEPYEWNTPAYKIFKTIDEITQWWEERTKTETE